MPVVETPASKKKANGIEKTEPKSALKRKAEDLISTKTPAKQSRLNDQSSILDEESRRREERNRRSIFLKGVGKLLKKGGDVKSLHPDITAVRTMGINAWALFPTEATCEKAYKQLEAKSVNGKKLSIDFCGKKAKNQSSKNQDFGLLISCFFYIIFN